MEHANSFANSTQLNQHVRAGGYEAPSSPPTRSDKEDAALKCYTFPYIEGKPDWDTAQHHQTKGLQWLFEEPQASRHGIHRAKWFVFLDDDTWVNVEALHGTLSRINWRSWLAMGYVWHHIYSDIDHFSGGSGVVVSAPVAKALAEGLYTRKGCEPRIVNGKVWNDGEPPESRLPRAVRSLHLALCVPRGRPHVAGPSARMKRGSLSHSLQCSCPSACERWAPCLSMATSSSRQRGRNSTGIAWILSRYSTRSPSTRSVAVPLGKNHPQRQQQRGFCVAATSASHRIAPL